MPNIFNMDLCHLNEIRGFKMRSNSEYDFRASKKEEQIEETLRQKSIIKLLLSNKDSQYYLTKIDSKNESSDILTLN